MLGAVMGRNANKVSLTRPYIKALKPDSERECFVWDKKEPGLGVRVRQSGAKTWVFQYRFKGRPLRMSLGNALAVHPEAARKQVIRLRAQVADGHNPAAEKAGERNAKTVSDLCDDYVQWLENRKHKPVKASTLTNERSRIKSHIKPLLGRKTVAALDVDAVERFFQDVADGKTAKERAEGQIGGIAQGGLSAAHRATDTLGAMLQYAAAKKLLTSNPVHLFTRQRDKPLPPPFSLGAVKALGKAMRELKTEGEPIIGIRAIRHLLLSGFRRMEGLTLTWGAVDAAAHCARLADTKTGPQTRTLGQAAIDHLTSFKPKDAKAKDFVFPGSGKAGHYVGLPKAWARIAERAKIEGVSIHGLRHWFASAAAEIGFSELVIAGLLGHTVGSVTGRYATTPDSALILAADRVSKKLAAALDSRPQS
jgi:integrase